MKEAVEQDCPRCHFDPSKGITALQGSLTLPDMPSGARKTMPEAVKLCGAPCSLYKDNTDGGTGRCQRTCTKPEGHAGPHICSSQHMLDGVVNNLQAEEEKVDGEVLTSRSSLALPRTVPPIAIPKLEMNNLSRHLHRVTVPHDWTFDALLQNGAERVLCDTKTHPVLTRPYGQNCPEFHMMIPELDRLDDETAPVLKDVADVVET